MQTIFLVLCDLTSASEFNCLADVGETWEVRSDTTVTDLTFICNIPEGAPCLNVAEGSTLTMNKVNIEPGKIHQGPGIQLAKSTKLKLTNVNFNSFKNAFITADDGTGININVDGCNMKGATGNFPPIYLPQPGADITISNSLFENNNIPQGKSAAVYVENPQNVIITNSIFRKNRGARYGSGLHVSGGGKLTMADSIFTSNQAVEGGAMALSYLQSFSIADSVFAFNQANYAGAIVNSYLEGGIFKSSNITDNTATINGGGILSFDSYFTFDDVIIKGNTAQDGQGNGIFCGGKKKKPALPSGGFDDGHSSGCQ